MSLLDRDRSVVVVIDLQGRLMDMIVSPDTVVPATRRLLRIAGLLGVPVILTEQYPRGLGPTHPEVRGTFDELEVPRRLVEKTAFGCCGEPAFEAALAELRPGVAAPDLQVVVAGIEAHVCVMQTVLELLGWGSEVHLCWECVSGRGEAYRRHALDRMQQAGACLTNHESAAFEWMRTKDHPAFKSVSALLKEGQVGG
jgi:nicotinamidase-related amidase